MLKKFKDTVNSAKNQVGDLKGSTNEKIQEYTEELNELLPVINRIGYEIRQIEIEIGISPKLIPHFSKIKEVSEDAVQAELYEYKDKKLSLFILTSLIKASKMQNIISIGNLKFTEVELELSVLPAVKLRFLPSNQ